MERGANVKEDIGDVTNQSGGIDWTAVTTAQNERLEARTFTESNVFIIRK